MNFNSWDFMLFLPMILGIYYLLNHKCQNAFLLAASYFFYGSWDWRFLSLLFVSTVVDYTAGLNIHRSSNPKVRRFFLCMSICVNLGILGTFKYFGFFVDSFANFAHFLGLGWSDFNPMKIILPVGISFYTFQTMSYTIDIYRSSFQPTKNFINFALYVSFFPQLVAGPIERGRRLLPQIARQRYISREMISNGVLLIVMGYFKKVFIADNLGIFVDHCFANYQDMSSLSLLKGLYYFTVQIYCDFSGYTDIARGIGYLLGIKLMENFRQPLLSASVIELWSRWHISFTSWLRDYVFYPLGGGRKGLMKAARNVFLTCALGGLWHGASWNFVLWGCYFGLVMALEWMFYSKSKHRVPNPPKNWSQASSVVLKILLTYHLFVFSGILFRSPDIVSAWEYGVRLFSLQPGLGLTSFGFILFFLSFALDFPQYISGNQFVYLRISPVIKWIAYGIAVFIISIFGNMLEVPFIYFQF